MKFLMAVLLLCGSLSWAQNVAKPDPKGIAVPKYKAIEYPNATASKLSRLYKKATGEGFKFDPEIEKIQFYFAQYGPLTNDELAKLVGISLRVEGYDLATGKEGLKVVKFELKEELKPVADLIAHMKSDPSSGAVCARAK